MLIITVTIWVIKIIENVTLKLIIMNVTVWIVKIMEDVTLILVIMQGWEFAHLLIAHSLNCSFCSNQMSDCERFAQDKWAPWANRSGLSYQKSDCEQMAQVAYDKWVTVSDSLIPSFWCAMWANRSGCSPKLSDDSESLRSLTKNKWPLAIRSGHSPKMRAWENEWITHFFEPITHLLIFLQKNKRFAEKTDEWIPGPVIMNVKKQRYL